MPDTRVTVSQMPPRGLFGPARVTAVGDGGITVLTSAGTLQRLTLTNAQIRQMRLTANSRVLIERVGSDGNHVRIRIQ